MTSKYSSDKTKQVVIRCVMASIMTARLWCGCLAVSQPSNHSNPSLGPRYIMPSDRRALLHQQVLTATTSSTSLELLQHSTVTDASPFPYLAISPSFLGVELFTFAPLIYRTGPASLAFQTLPYASNSCDLTAAHCCGRLCQSRHTYCRLCHLFFFFSFGKHSV